MRSYASIRADVALQVRPVLGTFVIEQSNYQEFAEGTQFMSSKIRCNFVTLLPRVCVASVVCKTRNRNHDGFERLRYFKAVVIIEINNAMYN